MHDAPRANDLGTIVDEPGLAELAGALAGAPWVALAGELNAARTYRPRLCLLQLNAGGRCAAVDPLAFEGRRPDPVAALLAPLEARTVVVHGGEYFVQALARDHHARLTRLSDTQQAAVLLGLPETGLRSLARTLLGVTLSPPVSVDWLKRPLALDHVAHALEHVRHLGALHAILAERIRAHDLEDELAIASAPTAPRPFALPDTPDPRRYRRIAGAAQLPPDGLQLLAAMVRWRDAKARELDVPPGRLLPNAQLVDLAHAPERALQRIAGMRFHSRLVHVDLEALRRAVTLALSEPADAPGQPSADAPRRPEPAALSKKGPPGPAVKARLQRLKGWRRGEAESRGVGLQAILPMAALEHLAFFPTTPLEEVPSLGRRRIERYAERLRALI